ncbi:hypothetical protein RZR97_02665 [Hydrogenimonas thermophila]|uniref:hypothetical protein n=1 Tax=Hydrogenimonas thermophila TaxID=223786 RepID=UPI0029373107|nr:hypothetical protein [Hydrogenimonas thermophila]WOE70482.1 hypothetical protein RZR91_02680 [Hydrogenimonas thermophila]WOE72999.1 hypothetical protein RZR97_02665 [Hydrogenimonas thermophila]
MIDHKDILDRLNISASEFYELAGTNQQKLSYHKKNNPTTYENLIYGAICRYYNLDPFKLIDVVDSLGKIKEVVNSLPLKDKEPIP